LFIQEVRYVGVPYPYRLHGLACSARRFASIQTRQVLQVPRVEMARGYNFERGLYMKEYCVYSLDKFADFLGAFSNKTKAISFAKKVSGEVVAFGLPGYQPGIGPVIWPQSKE
jgi:hypothetical protein